MSDHPKPSAPTTTRRAVLLGGAGAFALSALGGSALANAVASVGAGKPMAGDPFTLGVASGDPLPDSVVLWTRLATNPTASDGLGGMPSTAVPVEWQIATDQAFTNIVQQGSVDAVSDSAHSVHVEPAGLQPGAEYFYRFKANGFLSPVGRTGTAPAPGTLNTQLTMCFTSCSHYGAGYFTAYRRLAEDQPGLILHLGDYQYEYPAGDNDVRNVLGAETTTLAGYRQRHGQYKTDPDLQLAHATAPWLVVFDDHEVENNWAGPTPEASSQTPGAAFLTRRAAAFQAYYENMPLRGSAKPTGPDMRLYRRFAWGDLATFHMLDTRQYRDDQACGDGVKSDCTERLNPNRTITGADQERWITDGFNSTTARWDVLGQQVFFSQIDLVTGSAEGFNMDAWDGYKANRDRIASAMGNSQVRNGVVLTGDVHRHWAAEVKERFEDAASRKVGTELVSTSITSGGNGDDATNSTVLAENPHVKFYKNRRGYVRTTFTPTELRADFRILPYVTSAGAAVSTAQSFVVSDGDPTLHPA